MTFSGSLQPGPMRAQASRHSDDQIASRATQRLEWSVRVPEDTVEVKVLDGWVTLTGTVDWRYQKLAVESFVREIDGVCGVTNLVRVRPRPYDADVREQMIDLTWSWQHGRC